MTGQCILEIWVCQGNRLLPGVSSVLAFPSRGGQTALLRLLLVPLQLFGADTLLLVFLLHASLDHTLLAPLVLALCAPLSQHASSA